MHIQSTNSPVTHTQATYTHTLNPPPLAQPPSSFYLSFGSQHQSAQVQSLWWCYPHWCHKKYLSSLTLSSPALHLLCSSLHSAPGIPDSQHSPVSGQTAFNSPDHNAVTIATQVLLAEAAAALFGLWGELGTRREMRCWRERRWGREDGKLCRTHRRFFVFINGPSLNDCQSNSLIRGSFQDGLIN